MKIKPYRIITVYSDADKLERNLNNLKVEFIRRDKLHRFWGVEFTIMKPRGKGASKLCQELDKL